MDQQVEIPKSKPTRELIFATEPGSLLASIESDRLVINDSDDDFRGAPTELDLYAMSIMTIKSGYENTIMVEQESDGATLSKFRKGVRGGVPRVFRSSQNNKGVKFHTHPVTQDRGVYGSIKLPVVSLFEFLPSAWIEHSDFPGLEQRQKEIGDFEPNSTLLGMGYGETLNIIWSGGFTFYLGSKHLPRHLYIVDRMKQKLGVPDNKLAFSGKEHEYWRVLVGELAGKNFQGEEELDFPITKLLSDKGFTILMRNEQVFNKMTSCFLVMDWRKIMELKSEYRTVENIIFGDGLEKIICALGQEQLLVEENLTIHPNLAEANHSTKEVTTKVKLRRD